MSDKLISFDKYKMDVGARNIGEAAPELSTLEDYLDELKRIMKTRNLNNIKKFLATMASSDLPKAVCELAAQAARRSIFEPMKPNDIVRRYKAWDKFLVEFVTACEQSESDPQILGPVTKYAIDQIVKLHSELLNGATSATDFEWFEQEEAAANIDVESVA